MITYPYYRSLIFQFYLLPNLLDIYLLVSFNRNFVALYHRILTSKKRLLKKSQIHMATFYVIYSNSIDTFYAGSCLDFEAQLEGHQKNHFKKGYTSEATDWNHFFLIKDIPLDTARRIEKHVKKVKSREYFESLKSDPKIAEQLKEEFQTRSSR